MTWHSVNEPHDLTIRRELPRLDHVKVRVGVDLVLDQFVAVNGRGCGHLTTLSCCLLKYFVLKYRLSRENIFVGQ